MSLNDEQLNALDTATSRRLSRLTEQPVDVDALAKRIETQLAAEASLAPSPLGKLRWWLPRAASMAAAVLLAISVIFAVLNNGSQASAAVVDLSQLHEQIVDGRWGLQPVHNVEQANRWISQQSTDGPALPTHLADARVQSCCLTDVQGELAAVAVLQFRGSPITLVVAEAPSFAHEMGQVIEIDGQRFFGHTFNGVHMMMTNRDNRWLCVMGDVSYAELAQLAAQIRF